MGSPALVRRDGPRILSAPQWGCPWTGRRRKWLRREGLQVWPSVPFSWVVCVRSPWLQLLQDCSWFRIQGRWCRIGWSAIWRCRLPLTSWQISKRVNFYTPPHSYLHWLSTSAALASWLLVSLEAKVIPKRAQYTEITGKTYISSKIWLWNLFFHTD